jgi:hypothetical protein
VSFLNSRFELVPGADGAAGCVPETAPRGFGTVGSGGGGGSVTVVVVGKVGNVGSVTGGPPATATCVASPPPARPQRTMAPALEIDRLPIRILRW